MIKPFLLLLVFLLLICTTTVVHYIYSQSTQRALTSLVLLTHDATPALSVGFDKPRRLSGAEHHPIYPEMPSASPLGFVYVQ